MKILNKLEFSDGVIAYYYNDDVNNHILGNNPLVFSLSYDKYLTKKSNYTYEHWLSIIKNNKYTKDEYKYIKNLFRMLAIETNNDVVSIELVKKEIDIMGKALDKIKPECFVPVFELNRIISTDMLISIVRELKELGIIVERDPGYFYVTIKEKK